MQVYKFALVPFALQGGDLRSRTNHARSWKSGGTLRGRRVGVSEPDVLESGCKSDRWASGVATNCQRIVGTSNEVLIRSLLNHLVFFKAM